MDMQEINDEIRRLSNGETTYNSCFKLAALCGVKDHLEKSEVPAYSYAAEPEPKQIIDVPDSEFCKLFMAVPIEKALQILDEHMECIKLLYPKEYNLILFKLTSIL